MSEPAEALAGDDGFLIPLHRNGARPVTTFKTGHSPWPARCAYLSSAIFIGASGTTNVSMASARATASPHVACGPVSQAPWLLCLL